MEERLTRGEGKVRGGRQTYSARHLIDLAGSACLSSMICVARKTHVTCCTWFNASRDSNRVLTATWRRRATMSPSNRHGCGVSEAGVAGTCA